MDGGDGKRERACMRCYSQKLKCSRLPNQIDCSRCLRLRVPCKRRLCRDSKDRGESADQTNVPSRQYRTDCRDSHQALSTTGNMAQRLSYTPEPVLEFATEIHFEHDHPVAVEPGEWPNTDLNTPTRYEPFDALVTPPFSIANSPKIIFEQFDVSHFDADSQLHSTVFESPQMTTSDEPDFTRQNKWSLQPLGCTPSVTTNDPFLQDWINDLARLNAGICSYSTAPDASRDDPDVSQLLLAQSGHARHVDTINSRDANVREILRRALDLCNLVRLLHIGPDQHTSQAVPPTSTDQRAESRRKVDEILKSSSNMLLLASAYSRLLDRIAGLTVQMRNMSDGWSTPCTVSGLSLSHDSAVQKFLVVNMLELVLVQIEGTLRSVMHDADERVWPTNPFFHAANTVHDFPDGSNQGLSFVLRGVSKQQSSLISVLNQLRTKFMRNSIA